MATRSLIKRQVCLLLAIILLAGGFYLFADRPKHREAVAAPPHVISQRPHSYDPDWLEIKIILANKCQGCHRPDSDQTDFSSYETLMEAKRDGEDPLIVPGNIEDSVLWEYVNWNVHADSESDADDEPMMPPEKIEWLTAGQLDTIKRWIENGAFEFALPEGCDHTPVTEADYPSARVCKQCHPKQFNDWSQSMHAYAQHSPVFEAFNLTLVERTGGTIGTFCTRCHTPIGTALGENTSRRNANRSQISREGVTCIACHRRATGHYKSSGRVPIEPGSLTEGCFYGPFDDAESEEIGAHKSKSLPYIKTSQFCGECHDVTNPGGVRLEEAFSEWHNSPAAANGVTCQQCHMGPEPGVACPEHRRPTGRAAEVEGIDEEDLPIRHLTDHTFAGPDYSLLPDTEFPDKLDWMYEVDYRYEENLTPYQQKTLKELRKSNRAKLARATELRHKLLRNAACIHVSHPKTGKAGERVKLQVDVESLLAGHNLPTGFTAERQVWVEVTVRDVNGRVVFQSGDLDHNGDLRDDHSHEVLTGKIPFDPYLLNFQSKFVVQTNKGTERSVVISVNRHLTPINVLRPATGPSQSFGRPASFRVSKGSLPPLQTRSQKYPFRLPQTPGPCSVSVSLNFRHLPPTLLDHIGTPHLKHLLEIVEMDRYDCQIMVGP